MACGFGYRDDLITGKEPMNPEAYLEMANTESAHWWFAARRDILSHVIGKFGLPVSARILEVHARECLARIDAALIQGE